MTKPTEKLNWMTIAVLAGILAGPAALHFLPHRVMIPGFMTPAWADDDDDGDRGDDGGRASAGNSGPSGEIWQTFKKRKSTKRRAARAPAAQRALPLASPNQLIVRGASPQEIDALVNSGYTVLARTRGFEGVWTARLRIPSRVSLRRARDMARKLVPGASVEFNHYYRNGYRVQSSGVCKGENCKPFELVKWTASIRDCGILPEIGIVDTAVDVRHPALHGSPIAILPSPMQDKSATDAAHGTAVAAILSGGTESISPGLIPRVRLKAMNVFELGRSEDLRTDAFALSDAIETMARENVWLVNMSVAGPDNAVLESAVRQFSRRGGLIVAAAGNYGPSAPPAYPAAYDNVIAVAAVGENLQLYKRSSRGEHIDLSAPGVNIRSAGRKKGTQNFSGTSFAAPFVTAAAAILLSNGKTVAETVEVMKANAQDLGKPGPDAKYGAGLVQFSGTCDRP